MGGRYELYTAPPKRYYHEPETRPVWTNTVDEVRGVDGRWYTSNHATIWRWREAYQHDFAARIDWSNATAFEDANHPPSVIVNGDRTRNTIHLSAAPGQDVRLDASGTSDPDHDQLSYHWYPYREAGTFPLTIHYRNLEWKDTRTAVVSFPAPRSTTARTIHFVLEVTDDGSPRLTSYRRVILTIDPTLPGSLPP